MPLFTSNRILRHKAQLESFHFESDSFQFMEKSPSIALIGKLRKVDTTQHAASLSIECL
jgi:hypothetical protein